MIASVYKGFDQKWSFHKKETKKLSEFSSWDWATQFILNLSQVFVTTNLLLLKLKNIALLCYGVTIQS